MSDAPPDPAPTLAARLRDVLPPLHLHPALLQMQACGTRPLRRVLWMAGNAKAYSRLRVPTREEDQRAHLGRTEPIPRTVDTLYFTLGVIPALPYHLSYAEDGEWVTCSRTDHTDVLLSYVTTRDFLTGDHHGSLTELARHARAYGAGRDALSELLAAACIITSRNFVLDLETETFWTWSRDRGVTQRPEYAAQLHPMRRPLVVAP